MEKTELPQQSGHDSRFDFEEARRLIDRAFFGAIATLGYREQGGIRVDARLVDRDKAFLGNRLKISA